MASETKQKTDEIGLIKVSRLCEYIDQNIDKTISFLDLVELSGLNYQELVALFQAHKNTTPMQYIRAKREKQRGSL